MRLADLLAAAAKNHADREAAVFPGDRSFSWAEVYEQAGRITQRLADQGISAGDRVAILWENEPEALLAFWGAQQAGAQVVDVPHLAARATVEAILAEAKPKAIAIQPKLAEKLGGLSLPEVVDLERLPDRSTVEPLDVDQDDVALIIYTSGSTGRPKGVMLSHRNLISNISAANEWVRLTAEDRILVMVPLSFIHGRMQLLTHALVGGTLCFSGGFHFPATVVKEAEAHRVTGISGVPYHFKRLMKPLAGADLPALRYVLITGGALSHEELVRLDESIPNAGIHLAYGQTEASPRITYIGPDDLFERRGSCGRALPGTRVDILGEDGETLPPGEVGEVVSSGPHIMRGYVSGDERSSGRIDDQGRLRTGDLGRIDEDGFLYLMGRSNQMIKSSGERIFPKEIEDVLDSHPAIRESCVVGVPDEQLGERIIACVVLEDEAFDLPQMRSHCLTSMSFVRVPRALECFDQLPKTSSGKLDRTRVRALVLERLDR